MPSPAASGIEDHRRLKVSKVRTRYANGRGLTKFCSSHEIFTTKINNFANFDHFTKILCHENLELYGTCLSQCMNNFMVLKHCLEMSFNFVLLAVIVSTYGGLAVSSPFLLECRIPQNSSLDSVTVRNLTQEEREQLEIEGRCFLACATERYSNEVISTVPTMIIIKLTARIQ